MVVFALIVSYLAIVSEAPARETNLVRLMAEMSLVAALASLFKPRFGNYGLSVVFLSTALGAMLTNDYSRTIIGWTARILCAACMLQFAFRFGRRAWTSTVVQSGRWRAERDIAQHWLKVLAATEPPPSVLEFDSVSFWTGHFTYRLLRADWCWVVAKFKLGNIGNMQECRVYALQDVRRIASEQGAIGVAIKGTVIRGLKATPDMEARLTSCLAAR